MCPRRLSATVAPARRMPASEIEPGKGVAWRQSTASSIGDRTPGLQVVGDGSLTIYLQHDSPGPVKEPNWLPTPAGDFRPIMRMYQPRPEVLAGSYALRAIRKVG